MHLLQPCLAACPYPHCLERDNAQPNDPRLPEIVKLESHVLWFALKDSFSHFYKA